MTRPKLAIVVAWWLLELSTVGATVTWADYFFTDSELTDFYRASDANVGRHECEWDGYRMIKLEIFPVTDARQVYLVQRTAECGSAGCESTVLLRGNGKMTRIEDRFGLDVDRAERIARNSLDTIGRGRSDPGPHQPSATVVVLLMAGLCVLCGLISRWLAAGLPLWARIVLQTSAALLASGALLAFGVTDEVRLLSVPLIAGLTVTVIFSIKDMLG